MSKKQAGKRVASYSGANARLVLAVAFIFGLLLWRSVFGSPESFTVSAQSGDDPLPRPEATVAIFTNPALITINDSASPPTVASPYPSTITVSGMPDSMSNLRVTIFGLTHTFPDDIDIVLVGPQGQRSILMSDAGGGGDVTLLGPIGFEQAAVNTIPDSTTLTPGLLSHSTTPIRQTIVFRLPAQRSVSPIRQTSAFSTGQIQTASGAFTSLMMQIRTAVSSRRVGGWTLRYRL